MENISLYQHLGHYSPQYKILSTVHLTVHWFHVLKAWRLPRKFSQNRLTIEQTLLPSKLQEYEIVDPTIGCSVLTVKVYTTIQYTAG